MNDEYYMRLALQLAESASGQTSINPVVGCVLVKEGRIVGLGAHLKRGEGHAEANALRMAGEEAEGATAYVTLEPCSHYRKLTPPCSDRLIDAKVARVVVAALDPNPQVSGSGVAKLREAGIDVSVGLLEQQSHAMNEAFNKYIVTRQPYVTLKSASTLDGKVAAKTGDSRWISGPSSREAVHTMRHRHEGIMVGIGTLLADDPQLTTRLSVPALHPARIIVDSKLRIPLDARVVTDGIAPTIVLMSDGADSAKRDALLAAGVEVIECGNGPQVDLAVAMRLLGEREIGSILLEGGGRLNGAMLEAGLVDKIALFIAPKLIGGGAAAPSAFEFAGFDRMADAIQLESVTYEQHGDDMAIVGYPSNRFKP
ncbi:bifunctional diaminohydroxyphosphoribosylaminopyrimidine deaminase/5-amino-6-(5-phosphoribosylamino)uracil reductase RibD [Paenibacillus kobensis]|uniref:bifunctional diaminohydroxyphosphoribosylaminopyrimidine deaminase/5-amino-6-(5-phosphoribosylamino)uracil reductase RibD n=1 Tax=Paenibacillus kobensis TaxID=59841 RepID=UPI000FD8CC38|nr:bifunctional diaminohydroxyphosphoribosylaminopyrimidine deaminase/5-amino-6-(5-phosphoribosylamino)uracil reductase RibD [Paenibacillus kobensis]